MLAPHSMSTVDTEHCGRCEGDGVEERERESEEVCVEVCVTAGWILSVCYVHSKDEIYGSMLHCAWSYMVPSVYLTVLAPGAVAGQLGLIMISLQVSNVGRHF